MKKTIILLFTLICTIFEVQAQHEIIQISKTPAPNKAHIIVGNPVPNIVGQPSSMISFAGWGIQHAGFVWIPDNQSKGKLNLSFGGQDNGNLNSIKYTFQANGNFGIGTTSPDAKLSVNGKIHTKEVKVDLIGWSDFVFKNDYELPTLREVENHIKEKGHLKDIPNAKEVEKNGIYLGEMNAKLLQKIEELTLYTIQQEKRLNSIDLKNEKLKKENESLKFLATKFLELQKRLEKLEKK